MPSKSLNERAEYDRGYVEGYRLGQKDFADKVKAEIKGRIAGCKHGEEIVGDDFGIFAVSIQVYSNVLEIIDNIGKEDSE